MESLSEFETSAILKHKRNVDTSQAQQEIEEAEEEWDQVEANIPAKISTCTSSSPINVEEVIRHFKSEDMSYYMNSIKPVKERTGINLLKRWLFGPPKLLKSLIPDRNLIFAIAQCPFDTSSSLHVRVLQTVYKTLTGVSMDCPRYGKHWEEIGFQGIDPGSDLRGVGFLGLLHLMYLVLNPQTSELSKDIFLLSCNEVQNFPFCVMGINMTCIVLEALREEVLNKECNQRKDVFAVTNEFYAGVYFHLYLTWKEQRKTIKDSGYVLEDLRQFVKKNPTSVFSELLNYQDIKKRDNNSIQNFSDIGNIIQ